jgi:alpha-tubulin suppressor-like RCC1 family protein
MATLAVVNLGTGRTVLDIVSTYNHSCALLDNSTVKCWGRNNSGQLGAGNTTNIGDTTGDMGDNLLALPLTSFTPVKIFGGRQWSCAMNSSGGTRCWGLGTSGQLMSGSTSNIGSSAGQIAALTNINFGTGVVLNSITAGYYTGCGITTNKRIKCWGSALNGALLNGNTSNNLGDTGSELGDGLPWVNH